MDSGCNLNRDCPAAGITAQSADKYNACVKAQQAKEPVDGCKSTTDLSFQLSGSSNRRVRVLTMVTSQGFLSSPWAAWWLRPNLSVLGLLP